MPITPLPTAPDPNDPATFDSRAAAWVAALSAWTSQVNALPAVTATYQFLDGTVSSPGFQFASDTNTGIYRSASDELSFVTGGVQRLLLNGAAMSNVDSTTVPGLYYGYGGAHVSATAGDNPFSALNGAFTMQILRASIGATDEYLTQLAFPLKLTANAGVHSAARIRSRLTSGGGWSAWQELLSPERLLGTVSQSGGVPTGRVIERGSSANGEYVRFADGTQICWATIDETGTAWSTASGSLYTRASAYSWTFPAAFSANPVVPPPAAMRAAIDARGGAVNAVSTTSASLLPWAANSTGAGTTKSLLATAIGRWF